MTTEELNNLNNPQYLFHGTGSIIEEFEPRQAYNNKMPDGEPAVFASPNFDYAIFMALFNRENCRKGYRARVNSLNSNDLSYEATKDSIDQINDQSKGYVYVFNKSDFEQKNRSEWVSYQNVKPVTMVEISRKDFQPTINVLEE